MYEFKLLRNFKLKWCYGFFVSWVKVLGFANFDSGGYLLQNGIAGPIIEVCVNSHIVVIDYNEWRFNNACKIFEFLWIGHCSSLQNLHKAWIEIEIEFNK